MIETRILTLQRFIKNHSFIHKRENINRKLSDIIYHSTSKKAFFFVYLPQSEYSSSFPNPSHQTRQTDFAMNHAIELPAFFFWGINARADLWCKMYGNSVFYWKWWVQWNHRVFLNAWKKMPVIWAVNKNSINFPFDVYWLQMATLRIKATTPHVHPLERITLSHHFCFSLFERVVQPETFDWFSDETFCGDVIHWDWCSELHIDSWLTQNTRNALWPTSELN